MTSNKTIFTPLLGYLFLLLLCNIYCYTWIYNYDIYIATCDLWGYYSSNNISQKRWVTYWGLFAVPEHTGVVGRDCCCHTNTDRIETRTRRPSSKFRRLWRQSFQSLAWRFRDWTKRLSSTVLTPADNQPLGTAWVDGIGRVGRTVARTTAGTVGCPQTCPAGPINENDRPYFV